jgi:hypothetical protein
MELASQPQLMEDLGGAANWSGAQATRIEGADGNMTHYCTTSCKNAR